VGHGVEPATAAKAGVEEELSGARGLFEQAETKLSPILEVAEMHDLHSGEALLYGFSGDMFV